MTVLPDILVPGLKVVFCGTAVATASAERGHYYSQPSNKFWWLMHESGFTPWVFRPEEDVALPSLGIGITDLVKDVAQSHDRGLDYSGASGVLGHVVAAAPQWLAFNGKEAGKVAAKALGHRKPDLGVQRWTVGEAQVFVLPSSSAANARKDYDGRPAKVDWWIELAGLARRSG